MKMRPVWLSLWMGLPCLCLAPPKPPLLLAEVYLPGIDPKDYLMSEKLDGVRAYWDGKGFYFRSGRPIVAPPWFVEGFPKVPLDGELWGGRGRFEALSGWVRKNVPVDEDWRQIRYMVFEMPGVSGNFSIRVERMKDLVTKARVPWLQCAEQFAVADAQELRARLQGVIRLGGEGLMLHRRDAPYVSGRNAALFKLKAFLDAEATVVAHVPGKGRHQGRLGALWVEDDHGRRFKVGTGLTDAARDRPPALGTRITYRYQSVTKKGLPRFPVFVRVRLDE